MKTALVSLSLLICLLFGNCKDNAGNTSANSQRIADSLTKELQETERKMLSECEKLAEDSTYKKLFSAFCPSDTINEIPVSRHKKYPFDTLITKAKDTITYSFKVTNVCCVKYYGRYRLNADTLIISYNSCGQHCDCYCDYSLACKIPVKKYPYKHIRLETDSYLPFKN
jgi:hypothetical protein